MSWQVITNADVNQTEARQVMAKHGFFAPLQPTLITRTGDKSGLICHKGEELCFFVIGEGDIEALKSEPLINDVLKPPPVWMI